MNREPIALLGVHAYLDFVLDRTHQALRTSRLKAKELISQLVQKQKEVEPDDLLVPHFTQFLVAAWALNDALEDGELSECGDWVGWALAPAIEDKHEVEMQIGRLVAFCKSSAIRSWPGFTPTLVVYLGAFYYYTRRRTSMKEVAIEIWNIAFRLLMQIMSQPSDHIDPPEVYLGSSMLTWAAKEAPEQAQQLTAHVEQWVNDARLPAGVRSLYCLTLATHGGRYSQVSAADWAKRALGEFDDQLVGEQRLQMLATTFDATRDEEIEAILNEMQQLQGKRRQSLSPLAFVREAALKLDVIVPYFVRCLAIPRVEAAVRGLSYWHQSQHIGDQLDPGSTLLIMPFAPSGYVAVLGSKKCNIKREGQGLLERLCREADAFLGTAQTVAYADNSALKMPERPGVPDVYAEIDWLATLSEVYCPEGVRLEEDPDCQLMLPSYGHPIQAVQLLTWGTTWPIAASLSKPRPDRAVKCVALWSGGGSMTEAMEVEMLRRAFSSRGAHVDVFSPDSCTPEEFLLAYEDPKYDVFWVASHGEFDHWSPSRVELQIARDRTSVSIEFLHRKPLLGDSRRLLVLNVCDGGRFEEIGMIPRVGLAPGLAGPAQATISHLWPVLGFPSAAFGVSLAHYVAIGMPFFDAYKRAVTAVRKRAVEIAADLQQAYPEPHELIDRLATRDEDFSPIQISGSAAFFQ